MHLPNCDGAGVTVGDSPCDGGDDREGAGGREPGHELMGPGPGHDELVGGDDREGSKCQGDRLGGSS